MEICENADKGVPGNIYPTRNMDDEESSDFVQCVDTYKCLRIAICNIAANNRRRAVRSDGFGR